MLHFVGIERKNGIIIIDGYTTCKYRKNALKDVAKAIRPMDAAEADVIIEAMANGENPEAANTDSESYCLTLEPVGCATLYNEDTDEMEYAEANYYFMVRFTDREAEREEIETEIKRAEREEMIANLIQAKRKEIADAVDPVYVNGKAYVTHVNLDSAKMDAIQDVIQLVRDGKLTWDDHKAVYQAVLTYQLDDCGYVTVIRTRDLRELKNRQSLAKEGDRVSADELEYKLLSVVSEFNCSDMDVTEALIKIESLVDSLSRGRGFSCMSYKVNQVVDSVEKEVLKEVEDGISKVYMPLKHIRLLAQHGMYMRVVGHKVYASCDRPGTAGAEWDDMTNLSYNEIREWLGY